MKNTEFGISLAGGGLQGFAHIGALKALEELGIQIKYISGTSTGSAIAALYAMGCTPEEIKQICKEKYKKILKIRKKVLCQMAINFLLHKDVSDSPTIFSHAGFTCNMCPKLSIIIIPSAQ